MKLNSSNAGRALRWCKARRSTFVKRRSSDTDKCAHPSFLTDGLNPLTNSDPPTYCSLASRFTSDERREGERR